MIKKTLAGAVIALASTGLMAEAPGGPNCGWGNMVFEGKSGLPTHIFASLTNGATGNATFGMTSGTNGCSTDGTLTYGGENVVAILMDEFSEDAARGEGDAMTTVAVSYGVEAQDREHFAKVMQANFDSLFPSDQVTAAELNDALVAVMAQDEVLAKYV